MKITEKAKRIKYNESIIDDLKAQMEQLKEDISSKKVENDELKVEIIEEMTVNAVNKINEDGVSISMSDSPYSVIISDESAIPEKYKKEKIVIDIDKKGLIADKPEIEGIDFVQSKKLTIKV